jgi:hypothetical protein
MTEGSSPSHLKPVVNPGDREGKAVLVSYKTPAMLLIKSDVVGTSMPKQTETT